MGPAQSWFVQMNFGTVLGPMPLESVRQMARAGELIAMDWVRRGSHGDWECVSDLPELFSNPRDKITKLAAMSVTFSEEDDSGRPSTDPLPSAKSEPSRGASDIREVIMSPAKPIAVRRPKPPQSEAFDLLDQWKAERLQKREQQPLGSLAEELEASETAKSVAMASAMPMVSTPSVVPKPMKQPPSRPTSLALQIAACSRSQNKRPAGLTLELRKRSEVWLASVAVVILLVCLCGFWPKSHHAIYVRFVAIHKELTTRRADPKHLAALDTFVTKTSRELEKQIPWLEKHATPNDPEMLHLLMASRDCLKPMLKTPRQSVPLLETKLEYSLQALERFYSGRQSTTETTQRPGNKSAGSSNGTEANDDDAEVSSNS